MQATTVKKPGILINRNYSFLWFGQAISLIGDQVFNFTLVIWIAKFIAVQPDGSFAPWAPLAVSGALVAGYAPYFVLGPLAGVFADRWDKRRTMLRMDALRAVLIALLLVTVPQPFVGNGGQALLAALVPSLADAAGKLLIPVQLGSIYGIVFLASSCAQYFNPARLALVADVVPDKYRGQASGLAQAMGSLALVVGPPLAAPLLITLGVQWALIIDALSFVVSFLCVWAVRAPEAARSVTPGQRGNLGKEFRAGIRFAFTNRIVNTLLGLGFIAQLGTGAFEALAVFFVVQNLHARPENMGYLYGIFGFGAIAGALLAAALTRVVNPARLLVVGVFLSAVGFAVLARADSFLAGIVIAAVVGVIQGLVNVPIAPLLMRATPRAMLGRVSAVLSPTLSIGQLISVLLAGYLASDVVAGFHAQVAGIAFGPIDTIFTGSATLVLLTAIFAFIRLWGYNAPPQNPGLPQSEMASPGA